LPFLTAARFPHRPKPVERRSSPAEAEGRSSTRGPTSEEDEHPTLVSVVSRLPKKLGDRAPRWGWYSEIRWNWAAAPDEADLPLPEGIGESTPMRLTFRTPKGLAGRPR